MICPTCRGRHFISQGGADDDEIRHVPCPDCIGGIASCCDAAGSSDAPSFTCPRCGAVSYNLNDVAERYCGRCHAFEMDVATQGLFVCAVCGALQRKRMRSCEECGSTRLQPSCMAPYRDQRFLERPCDHCGKLYRGPAVYCSLDCAIADA